MNNFSFQRLLSKRNFPKFAAASMMISGLAGLAMFAIIQPGSNVPDSHNTHKKSMSQEEAIVRAMVEKAQTSSWKENLETASMAQERFVLPGRQRDSKQAEFVKDIQQRSNVIRSDRQKQVDLDRQKKEEAKKWNDSNFSNTWSSTK